MSLFRGVVYRGHHPGWAWDPESGEGAVLHGGRFNPVGMPALYTSIDPQTAWLEAQQGFAYKPQPLTLCAYQVSCEDIFDLTHSSVRSELGVSLADLGCPWEDLIDRGLEPPSHRIALRLFDRGGAGIIVPSFAHRAGANNINIVFWRWSRSPPHQLTVIGDQARLPQDDRSWRSGS